MDLTAIIDSLRDPWAHELIRFVGLLFRWVVALKHLQSSLDTATISVLDIHHSKCSVETIVHTIRAYDAVSSIFLGSDLNNTDPVPEDPNSFTPIVVLCTLGITMIVSPRVR